MTSSTSSDIRERIIRAANQLYEENGRESFPPVDAVRKLARVSMNDASRVMKEWRRAQSVQATPIAVQIPESLMTLGNQSLAAIWQEAQDLANDNLRTAQAAWDSERQELDDMRLELSEAYEAQASDLEQLLTRSAAEKEQLNARIDALLQQNEATRAEWQLAENHVKRLEKDTAVANAALDEAHHQIASMTGQIDDLKTENRALREQLLTENEVLSKTQSDLVRTQATANAQAESFKEQREAAAQETNRQAERYSKVQAELDALREQLLSANETLAKTQSDLVRAQATSDAQAESFKEQRQAAALEASRQAERYTKVQAELDQAIKEAGEARERAAELTGKLSALQEQNAALLSKVSAVRSGSGK